MEQIEQKKAEKFLNAKKNRRKVFEEEVKRIEGQMMKASIRDYQIALNIKEGKNKMVKQRVKASRRKSWRRSKNADRKSKSSLGKRN